LLTVAGLAASLYTAGHLEKQAFGALDNPRAMRIVIPAALFLTLRAQTIRSSFFLSVLGMRRR